MNTSGHLHRRAEQPMAALAKKEESPRSTGGFVWKEMWPVVRRLTPAEGLALVCLTSWVQEKTGLAQASDREVCSETGISRDVMKRLRRKLGAIGIRVTPGNNLSQDSCSYDFRKVLKVPRPESANRGANPGKPTPHVSNVQLASLSVPISGSSGGGLAREPGAQPQGELTSCGATVQIAYEDLEFEVDLPSDWDDDLERQFDSRRAQHMAVQEQPVPPPLPPYEAWLARR
jgi:hypothetical protein